MSLPVQLKREDCTLPPIPYNRNEENDREKQKERILILFFNIFMDITGSEIHEIVGPF